MTSWIFRGGIALALLLGVYLRVDRLDAPHYWYDEAITSLRVSGFAEREVAEYASSRDVVRFGDVRRFLDRRADSTFADTLRSLREEDPQHTPLFYLLARGWVAAVGDSVAKERLLAALIGIAALGALFWLALELFVRSGAFASAEVCWLAAALTALSPYQVVYAREYREYSLWTLAIAVACACLLRARRLDTVAAWGCYAAAMALNFQVHLFGAMLGAGLGCWVLARDGFRRAFWRYLAATGAAALGVLPWLWQIVQHQAVTGKDTSWIFTYGIGKFQLWYSFAAALRTADLAAADLEGLLEADAQLLTVAAVVMVAAALGYRMPASLRGPVGFLAALVLASSGLLFAVDYFTGSIFGWLQRYSPMAALGWSLTLAGALARWAADNGPAGWAARAVGVGVLVIAAVSSDRIHYERQTFAKNFADGDAINYLNSAADTTVLSDELAGAVLALSEHVKPELPLVWQARCSACAPHPAVAAIPAAPANGKLCTTALGTGRRRVLNVRSSKTVLETRAFTRHRHPCSTPRALCSS